MKKVFAIFTVLLIGVFGLFAFSACSDDDPTPMEPPETPAFINLTADKIQPIEYTGAAFTPDVTVRNGDTVLVKDVDYTVTYADNKAVGSAKVTITFIGAYDGNEAIVKRFDILPISSEKVTINEIASRVYDGTAYEPAIELKHGNKTLVAGTDYDKITYTNNINVGTAKVTVELKGVYGGYVIGDYEITKKHIAVGDVTIALADPEEKLYQSIGGALKPELSVKVYGNELIEGDEYTVEYCDNVYLTDGQNKGTGKATVNFVSDGNYDFSDITQNFVNFEFFAPIETRAFHAAVNVLSDPFYAGDKLSYIDADGRGTFEYKAIMKEDGLYLAAVAKRVDAPDYEGGAGGANNIEYIFYGKSGSVTQQGFAYLLNNEDIYSASYTDSVGTRAATYAVMRTHEIDEGDYKHAIVLEAFFSDEKLEEMGYEKSEYEKMFRMIMGHNSQYSSNGKWLPAGYGYNGIDKRDIGNFSCNSAIVGADGIAIYKSTTAGIDLGEGIILGKGADEWADYSGHTAKVTGIKVTDTKSSLGLTFEFKSVAKASGMYFYSESKVPVKDNIGADGSGLSLEVFVQKGTDAQKRLGYYYFKNATMRQTKGDYTSTFVPQYAVLNETDSGVVGAADRYHTTVEGYLPWNLFNVAYGETIINENGEVVTGYKIGVNAYWRVYRWQSTYPEDTYTRVYTDSTIGGTSNTIAERGVGNSISSNYWFDENGNMTCQFDGGNDAAKGLTVDGNIGDWTAKFANINRYKWARTFTKKDDNTVKHTYTRYNYLGEDGLYGAIEVTNLPSLVADGWKGTNIEVSFGAYDKSTYVRPIYFMYTGASSEKAGMVMRAEKAEYSGTTYDATFTDGTLTLEYFIPNAALESTYGAAVTPLTGVIFYYSNGYEVTPALSKFWWALGAKNQVDTAKEFRFVTANGMYQ